MTPILSLSTAWCSQRHADGYAMLQEIAGLGFTHVELSHGIRIVLVPGILRALEEGVIKVSSTHNFCPLPAGLVHPAPNLFEPSARASRSHEHDQWLRHTRRTIDFAVQVGAPVVVTHLGSVRFLWRHPGRALRHYLQRHPVADPAGDERYQRRLARCLGRLRRRQPPFWDQTRRSVEEMLPYAAAKGVRLAFENRETFEELPLDDDFADLFQVPGARDAAGYWHDAGHAELKQRMGLATQRRLLEANCGRLLGFHLHDVDAEGHDHQPVGHGSVDFRAIREFWQPHHRLVLELNPRVTTAEVLESKRRIEDLLA
jgi:sugar phosphate isomerase/epimerase